MGRRWWPLFLLFYLMFDFAHPWVPGVFFFEGDQLFVDGVVTPGKAMPPRLALAAGPQSALRVDDPNRAVAQSWSGRGETRRRLTPWIERQYSARSHDRSPLPSSSPDAH
jgi:hypothetical protein